MINSMTGYGSAEARNDTLSCVVEIKTVNNRYFKTRLKLAEPVSFLEDDVEKILRGELYRGMINYVLHLKDVGPEVFVNINEKMLKSYAEKLSRIAASAGGNKCTVDIGNLLSLPEVISPSMPDEKTAEMLKELAYQATRKAIKSVRQMRRAEGAVLAEEFVKYCEQIKQKLLLIKERSGEVVKQYSEILKKRADELLEKSNLNVDAHILAMEVAVFAERCDITEEVARLESHIGQFTNCLVEESGQGSCPEGNQAGRRLDFLSQEMLREANTIASKANDSKIIHWVVDIKCLIDRIKEQVQNVE